MRGASINNGCQERSPWFQPRLIVDESSEMNQVRGFQLAHSVAISFLLHAGLVLFFVALTMYPPRHQRHSGNRLNVELFGVVSARQMAAQQMRIVGPRTGGGPPRQQDTQKARRDNAQKQRPPAYNQAPVVLSESPAGMPGAVKLPVLPAAPPGEASGSGSGGAQGRAGGAFGQRQQFLGVRTEAGNNLSAYLEQLTKRVRANLLYPLAAKKRRMEGVSLIGFVVTESGEIKPGTLTVKKSSGYELLDSCALKSTLASAPFPRPPRELSVAIAVAFEVDD
jgi:protein TonB